MRRLSIIFLSILLLAALCIPALGANYASKLQVSAIVGSDKSCQVTVSATLHIEQSGNELLLPIPPDATGVTLNGTRVRTHKSDQVQQVDLSEAVRNMTGDLSITVSYTLPNVIGTDEVGEPELQLPVLSGFKSSISQLDFTVTLPGQIAAKPSFSSGYHQANIEKDLSCTVNGNTVVGCSTAELKDHETLTMYLPVEKGWFPDAPLEFFESSADDIAMLVCGVLALVYWLIFLRFLPPKRKLSPTVPEGMTAGQLGAVITLGKADLSLMVFSWAQLGYVQIQSGSRRVLLHKIMDMGNERSDFEQRCFQRLFAGKNTVDTAGVFYANQCRALMKQSPNLQPMVRKNSGNPKVFRALAALICLFGGVSFGVAMTQEAVIQGFWIFLTALLGLVCGFYMQLPAGELFLRKTGKTAMGLCFTALWLLLGLIAGQFGLALLTMAAQYLAGAMVSYGGRRTEEGKQEFARIFGLRLFLKSVSKEELHRIQSVDPEYFHSLAPYALALGVSRGFAQRFGKNRVPDCPYINCKTDKLHTAKQWTEKMEKTLWNMNRRSRLLPLERFLAIFSTQPPKKNRKK